MNTSVGTIDGYADIKSNKVSKKKCSWAICSVFKSKKRLEEQVVELRDKNEQFENEIKKLNERNALLQKEVREMKNRVWKSGSNERMFSTTFSGHQDTTADQDSTNKVSLTWTRWRKKHNFLQLRLQYTITGFWGFGVVGVDGVAVFG